MNIVPSTPTAMPRGRRSPSSPVPSFPTPRSTAPSADSSTTRELPESTTKTLPREPTAMPDGTCSPSSAAKGLHVVASKNKAENSTDTGRRSMPQPRSSHKRHQEDYPHGQ